MDGSAFSVKLLLYDLTRGVGNGSAIASEISIPRGSFLKSRVRQDKLAKDRR